ncbi:hypothetical protein [Marinomonas pollencensis]|uniref:Lactonase family protein with 7-bladed beta-propeller n=1 Tax=Marinomonas pollencensis TaxID=491954 RepID=A0A3E0DKV2_9GAMM|nr:hypothetical protein [Marinomonas pollencensis]REG82705.1 hypothetical protein DFP81_108139 [Marinomonas pollencensis]
MGKVFTIAALSVCLISPLMAKSTPETSLAITPTPNANLLINTVDVGHNKKNITLASFPKKYIYTVSEMSRGKQTNEKLTLNSINTV